MRLPQGLMQCCAIVVLAQCSTRYGTLCVLLLLNARIIAAYTDREGFVVYSIRLGTKQS